MGLHIITYNANGLLDKQKRQGVFELAKAKNVDILILQETHVHCQKEAAKFEKDWGSKGFWSFGISNKQCGVGILFNSQLQYKVMSFNFDPVGRYIVINLALGEQQFCIINVYAPNDIKERKVFFNNLDRHLTGRKHFILTGDFNCVENLQLDKVGGDPQSGNKGADVLKNLCSTFNLVDVFRKKHPQSKEYTYVSTCNNVRSRLDRFYISSSLFSMVEMIINSPNPYSDHAMVSLKFKAFDEDSFSYGPGYWKCNTSILDNTAFVKEFEELWLRLNITDIKDGPWWENCKAHFKDLIIMHSRKISSDYYQTVQKLEAKLRHYHILNHNNPGEFESVIASLNTTLTELIKDHLSGSKIRAKVKHLKNDDHPTRFFLRKEISTSKKKTLKVLHTDNLILTTATEITAACREFYQSLLSYEPVDDDMKREFLTGLPTLLAEEQNLCEGYLSYEECWQSIKQMENRKTPGSDGLPKEFYLKFFPLFGKSFVQMINNCYEMGSLTESQRYGIISILCKKPEASQFLTNWRPISLLNVDYKIISKSLCNRLKLVMSKLISVDQTCSVPTRSIADNCHLLRCIVDYSVQKDIPIAIINLDQAKAFDRVSHSFLFDCLKAYGFGPSFLKWIKLLYTDISSSVLVNGHISEPFSVSRSVRQGCGLSPLLYVLSIEPFALKIKSHSGIMGLSLPGTVEKLEISQFADDNSLVCTDYKSIRHVFEVSENFCRASGAKLNKDKCKGLWLGAWKNNSDQLCGIKWNNGVEKMVGILFGNGDFVQTNWDVVYQKFDRVITDWRSRSLSMKGKAVIANTLALSKLIYVGTILPISKQYFQKFNTLLFSFIWGNKPEAVARNVLFNKCINGGISLLHIRIKLQALQIMHLKHFIFGTEAKWQYFTRYWVGIYLRKFNVSCDSNNVPHSSPDNIPLFYREALNALHNLFTVQPDFDLQTATCKTVYWTLIKPELRKPNIESKFPLVQFSRVWQSIDSSFLDSFIRDTSWRIAHHVLPIGEQLYFKGISNRLKCYFCHDREMFEHLFCTCPLVQYLIQWIEQLIADILGHNYAITSKAMVFCDIIPTGFSSCDKLVLYLTCLAKHVIWSERNYAKFENKDVTGMGLINIFLAHLRLRILADFQRLNNKDFQSIWCKSNRICHIENKKVIFSI